MPTPNVPRRRVVTGLDADGQSHVALDGPTPGHHTVGTNDVDVLWREAALPPTLAADGDRPDPAVVDQIDREPPPGGLEWRVVTMPPTSPNASSEWHVTSSIDFGIVLSGEIELQLERENVRLAAGDCIVQRAARHRWVNHGPEPCIISFTNVSARPADVVT